jgi:hypothetical protein
MRVFSPLVFLLLLSACSDDPVDWSDPVFLGAPMAPNEYSARSVPDSKGCATSFRIASNGKFSYGAWWRVNADSSASLMVARAADSSTWEKPVIADSTDHSIRGCGRPAPAIAADTVTGYVHLAYYLEPDAGPGIFSAHSMDGGLTFHAAVPILFGKNPARVSVSSLGDRVVVAYEDPNSVQPVIGVALSETMGHLFKARMQATSSNGRARQPVVRLSRDSIRLWWSEYSADPSVSATRPAYEAGRWN